MSPGAPALELRGIVKAFGSVQALRGADFVLAPGEVHALLGENGAGKSTLLRIAYGMLPPDSGMLQIGGSTRSFHSPRDAQSAGIGMVHQHFTSIGALSVGENIALAVGPAGRQPAPRIPEALRAGLVSEARADSLSVALRQRLEIVKALATGARILLLDEPSAVLAPSEVEALLAQIRGFAAAGGSVALVTHKLGEVFAAADQVTVLREGRTQFRGRVRETTASELVAAMIGESSADLMATRERAAPPSPAALPGAVVGTLGDRAIHRGELVGVAAIEGNGQRELLHRLALASPGATALVPEDRSTEGLIPAMSLTENIVLGRSGDRRWSRGPWLDWRAAGARTVELMASFGIRAAGPGVPAATLSGGNQQRLLLARALDGAPQLLVAENPTRGLDVRATAEVHERLREAARRGIAVVVYSSDLDEVLLLGQRILVVHQGRVTEAPPGADRGTIGNLMLGIPSAV
jgi:simple sugar transport system ATP-binding protein